MIEINRRAYRAHELNEKYEIKKTEKKTFLEEERISETLTVGLGTVRGRLGAPDGSRSVTDRSETFQRLRIKWKIIPIRIHCSRRFALSQWDSWKDRTSAGRRRPPRFRISLFPPWVPWHWSQTFAYQAWVSGRKQGHPATKKGGNECLNGPGRREHRRPVEPWKGYNLKDALSDLVSGLTVAFVRIPQGMAYAFLAGVQPQYGLYTGLDRFIIDPSFWLASFYRQVELYSCVFYALFATSKHNSVGSTSIMSMLSGDVIENEYPDLGWNCFLIGRNANQLNFS